MVRRALRGRRTAELAAKDCAFARSLTCPIVRAVLLLVVGRR
jgi:hypothetical protein